MCDCAVGVPLDGLDAGGGDSAAVPASRVTAKLGHLLVDTTWAQPETAAATGGSEGERPGTLDVEALLSSAVVELEPEGFEILEAVHVRAVGAIPLGAAGAGSADGAIRGGGSGDEVASNSSPPPRDELAEKLREKTGRDDHDHPAAVTLLPLRPVLRRGQGDAGGCPDRARLGVAVSPVRFNITEAHVLGLACCALSASTRLAAVAGALAPPISCCPDAQRGRDDGEGVGSAAAVGEADEGLVGDDSDREGRASRLGSLAAPQGEGAGEPCEGVAGDGDQAAAAAAVAATSPLPRCNQEAQQIPDGVPLEHQHTNGLLSTEGGRLDGALSDGDGGSDQPRSSKQFAGEGEPAVAVASAVSETGPAVPPAFLGTLIIEAISVMLLKDSRGFTDGAGVTGDPSGGLAAGMDTLPGQPAAGAGAAGANTAVLAAHRLRPALSPRRARSERRWRSADTTSTGLLAPCRRRYSGMVYLEIAGIGAGIDLPLPWRTSPPPTTSPGVSPAAAAVEMEKEEEEEEEGKSEADTRVQQQQQRQQQKQQQYLAEFAVKRISLTDVSAERRRRGSLSRLVGGGAASGAPARSAAAGGALASGVGGTGEHRRNDVDGENVRVLPRGWWHRHSGENGGDLDAGYDEQVLVRAGFCPASGTATVDANLASSRLMLLPAPILDALDLVAGVERGIAKFSRRRADPESGPGGHNDASDGGMHAPQLSTGGGALCDRRDGRLSTAAASSPSQVDDAASTPRDVTPGGGPLRNDVSTALAPALGGRRTAGAADEQPDGGGSSTLPLTRREDRGGGAAGDHEEFGNHASWRWQMIRALSGAGLVDLLLLRRINLSASAEDLQLWLPGVEKEDTAVTPAAAAGGSTHGGVEAVVAACGRCHGAVSIALHLLSTEATEPDNAEQAADPTAAPATAPGDPGWSDAQRAGAPGDGADVGDAAGAGAAQSPAADLCDDELCVVSLGLHDLEVFVARPSAADFGAPSFESPQPAPLGAESETQPSPASENGCCLQAGLSNAEGLVLPFSVDFSHVLTARPISPSSSAPPSVVAPSAVTPSPLLSEVDVSVTAVQVVLFLDFPLASRIVTNSFGPLLSGGAPASGGAPSGTAAAATQGAAGTPAVAHGLSSSLSPSSQGGRSGPATVITAGAAAGTSPAAGTATAASSLAEMWACRVGFKAAGLRAKIVNNFYRQKRPCVIVNVRNLALF